MLACNDSHSDRCVCISVAVLLAKRSGARLDSHHVQVSQVVELVGWLARGELGIGGEPMRSASQEEFDEHWHTHCVEG